MPATASGQRNAPRSLILGIGNLLMGDEGFGPHLVRRLERGGVPESFVVEDGGVGGVDLLPRLQEFDRVLLIDALRPGPRMDDRRVAETARADSPAERTSFRDRGSGAVGEPASGGAPPGQPAPGDVVVFRLNRVKLLNPDPRVSLHGCSLGGLLRLAEALHLELPEITVLGFVPVRIDWTDRLSVEAEKALAGAEDQVRRWIGEVACAS
ncbi:MAG: hydrogenase maturation protease [Candidatus Eisenbacteria bacterium]